MYHLSSSHPDLSPLKKKDRKTVLDESPALMTSLGSDKSTTLSMVGSDDIDLVTMNEVI